MSLDVGTSSVRALLFDGDAVQQDGFGCQIEYKITTTSAGAAEISADALFDLVARCLSTVHEQVIAASIRPAAVGFCTFWHSFLGTNGQGKPATPILHLFDTRSAPQVEQIAAKVDRSALHAQTGCPLHSSYWPSKLLWLKQRGVVAERWVSFGEYVFLRLFGVGVDSTSMISGSGLWDQQRNVYAEALLEVIGITEAELPSCFDQPQSQLRAPFRALWPAFNEIPWFPAVGDGACNHVGSGCRPEVDFSLMVGTSGAMRVMFEHTPAEIPEGLWCYRVDPRRYLLGGALSNGGDVYAWAHTVLALSDGAAIESALASASPGAHRLSVLPFFAGERSPYWRPDLKATITGLTLSTRAIDILQASLESVALRFLEIFDLMVCAVAKPDRTVASGGALLHSPAWTQMMADAIGVPVLACVEPEATSRGAALLALERLGSIQSLSERSPRIGPEYTSREAEHAAYLDLLARQQDLYNRLWLQ